MASIPRNQSKSRTHSKASVPRARPAPNPGAVKAVVPPVAIVVSRYNATITDRLLDGARASYAAAGGNPDSLLVVDAPGSFEIPALALAAAMSGKVRGVVTLGCIIRGETQHDQYLAHAVAHGIVEVTMRTSIPVTFGVVTTENVEQAEARAGGAHGNKGAEAMEALLLTIAAADSIGHARTKTQSARPDKAKKKGLR